jgi:hypothetical protein
MSKERRVDSQITVGLLTTGAGVPAGCASVRMQACQDRDQGLGLGLAGRGCRCRDAVLGERGGIGEAGFAFIVGSRPSSAVDDLADPLPAPREYFTDGQAVEATRTMGTGKDSRKRPVV